MALSLISAAAGDAHSHEQVIGPDDNSFKLVLGWIQAASGESPSLIGLPGVSPSESRQLARLAVLIRSSLLRRPAVASSLASVLQVHGASMPPTDVAAAFRKLENNDAIRALAALYASVVTPANRRMLGTFFTPSAEATSMVTDYHSRFGAPGEVVDVGAGVGVFSEAARRQWPSTRIYAVDINPVTLGLQALAVRHRADSKLSLELGDYRSWLASFVPEGPTLFLGNPPYTRWQLIAADERKTLVDAAGGLVATRANLSTLFLAMTLRKLRPEDSLAMIIPAGWMHAAYAKGLRARLREMSARRISLRLADSWRFDSAIVDAIVVEVGPEETAPQNIFLSDWSSAQSLVLDRTRKDSAFESLAGGTPTAAADTGRRLGDLAVVSRGTATGANEFFVFTDLQRQKARLPEDKLKRLLRRLRPGTNPAEPRAELSWLLVLDQESRFRNVRCKELVDHGEELGFDKRHLCDKRSIWFDLSKEIKTPDVVLGALGRGHFHLAENPQGWAITNNLFGLSWRADISDSWRQSIINWLRSESGQQALAESASTEANGLLRLSPRAVENISVPDNPELALITPTVDLKIE